MLLAWESELEPDHIPGPKIVPSPRWAKAGRKVIFCLSFLGICGSLLHGHLQPNPGPLMVHIAPSK